MIYKVLRQAPTNNTYLEWYVEDYISQQPITDIRRWNVNTAGGDISSALTSAFNYFDTVSGGTLFIPTGYYKFSSTSVLNLNYPVKIIGNGYNNTEFIIDSAHPSAASDALFDIQGSSPVIFENFKIRNPSQINIPLFRINQASPNWIGIKGIRIEDLYDYFVYYRATGSHKTFWINQPYIKDVRIDNGNTTTNPPIYIEGIEGVKIEEVYFDLNHTVAGSIANTYHIHCRDCSRITIKNSMLRGTRATEFIRFDSTSYNINNNQIENISFSRGLGNNAYLVALRAFNITDNDTVGVGNSVNNLKVADDGTPENCLVFIDPENQTIPYTSAASAVYLLNTEKVHVPQWNKEHLSIGNAVDSGKSVEHGVLKIKERWNLVKNDDYYGLSLHQEFASSAGANFTATGLSAYNELINRTYLNTYAIIGDIQASAGTTTTAAHTLYGKMPRGPGTINNGYVLYAEGPRNYTAPTVNWSGYFEGNVNIGASGAGWNDLTAHLTFGNRGNKIWSPNVNVLALSGANQIQLYSTLVSGTNIVVTNLTATSLTGSNVSANSLSVSGKDIIEYIHDAAYGVLSAGPGIAIIYDDPNNLIEISVSAIPLSAISGAICPTEYLHLSGGSQPLSSDWDVGTSAIRLEKLYSRNTSSSNINVSATSAFNVSASYSTFIGRVGFGELAPTGPIHVTNDLISDELYPNNSIYTESTYTGNTSARNLTHHSIYINVDDYVSACSGFNRNLRGLRINADEYGEPSSIYMFYNLYNSRCRTSGYDATGIQATQYNQFAIQTDALSGTINDIRGIYTGIINNSSATTANNVYGVYSLINQDDVGGAMLDARGFYAKLDRDNGSAVSGFGLRVDFDGTWDTKYGIYTTDENYNYFEGNIGIGSIERPVYKLQIIHADNTLGWFESTDEKAEIVFKDTSATYRIGTASGALFLGNNSGIQDNNVIITSAGYIGINSDIPTNAILDIKALNSENFLFLGTGDMQYKFKTNSDATANRAMIVLGKSKGTTPGIDEPTSAGDRLGELVFAGTDQAPGERYSHILRATQIGDPSANTIHSDLEFMVDNVSAGRLTQMILNYQGRLGLGEDFDSPLGRFHVYDDADAIYIGKNSATSAVFISLQNSRGFFGIDDSLATYSGYGSSVFMKAGGTRGLAFNVNNSSSPALAIVSSGRIGIGVSATSVDTDSHVTIRNVREPENFILCKSTLDQDCVRLREDSSQFGLVQAYDSDENCRVVLDGHGLIYVMPATGTSHPRLGLGDTAPIANIEINDEYNEGETYSGVYSNIDTSPSALNPSGTGRTHRAFQYNIDSYTSAWTGGGNYSVYGMRGDIDAYGNPTYLYGVYNNIKWSPVGNGSHTTKYVMGTANVITMPDITEGPKKISNVYCTYNLWKNDSSAASATTVYGSYNALNQDDSGGGVETQIGVYAWLNRDSGTAIDGYCFKGDYDGTFIGNKYGIYITDETYNYFSGNVGIGDVASTGAPLHILDTSETLALFESSDEGAWIAVKDDVDTFYVCSSGGAMALGAYQGYSESNVIISNNGKVGIGGGAPGVYPLMIVGTSLAAGSRSNVLIDGFSDAAEVSAPQTHKGIDNKLDMYTSGSSFSYTIHGQRNDIDIFGNASNVIGTYNYIKTKIPGENSYSGTYIEGTNNTILLAADTHGTKEWTNIYCNFNVWRNSTTGSSATNVYGTYSELNQDVAGGGVENKIGSYVYLNQDGGTCVNGYAFKAYFQGTFTGNLYGFYSDGEDYNYFSGRVGIGIDNPGEMLEVHDGNIEISRDDGNNPYMIINAETGKDPGLEYKENSVRKWVVWNDSSSDNLRFNDDSATVMYLTNDNKMVLEGTRSITMDGNAGRVGIGIASPACALHSQSSATIYHTIETTDTAEQAILRLISDNDIWDIKTVAAGDLVIRDQTVGNDVIRIEASAGANSIRINSDGYVGINEATPAAELDVNGAVYGTTSEWAMHARQVSIYSGNVKIRGSAGGYALTYGFRSTSGAEFGGFGCKGSTETLNYFYIGTHSAAEYMKIMSGGNIGINLPFGTDPLSHLHIYNGAAAVILTLESVTNATTRYKNGTQEWDTGLRFDLSHNYSISDVTNSKFPFQIEPSTLNNTLYLDANGVGINNANPGAKLDIIDSADLQMRLGTTTAAYWNMGRDPSTGDFHIEEVDLGNAICIDKDNGYVGIGSIVPSGPLFVKGSVNGSASNNCVTIDSNMIADQLSPSGTSRTDRGLFIDIDTYLSAHAGGGTLTLNGMRNDITNLGDVTNVMCNYNYLKHQSTGDHAWTTTALYGNYNLIILMSALAGPKVVTNVYCNYSTYRNDTSAATATNAFGSYVHINQDDAGGGTENSVGFHAWLNRDAGTAVNGYCFRGNFDGTYTGNKFGIYVQDEDYNYFSGNLLIGAPTVSAGGFVTPLYVYHSTYNEMAIFRSGDAISYVTIRDDDYTNCLRIGYRSNTSLAWFGPNSVADVGVIHETSSGKTFIGDYGSGDYTLIEADGTIGFAGDATVWEDLRVPGTSMHKSANDPDWVSVNDAMTFYALGFDSSSEEQIFFTIQLPHSYKEGSDIYPHIHWVPFSDSSGSVMWQLEYCWENISGTYDSATTISALGPTNEIEHQHIITSLPSIDGTGKTISSILMCRLFRDGGETDDTYPHDGCLLEFDIHFEKDTLGSRQELVK